MNIGAFYPQPDVASVLVLASSSTASTPVAISAGWASAAHLANPSTQALYVAIGSSSVVAAFPTTAGQAGGFCLPAGGTRVIGFGPGASRSWISAATSASSAAPGLVVTPGQMGL